MHATGIICEYNPFHNGHKYHIEKTRELTNCDVLICAMSGNFVQRGEPAIIDKWERTKHALQHGVDLVIEIPFPFVMQSADYFAQGAVQLLHLANVKEIVFGSETNDLASLKKIADANIDTTSQRKDESLVSFYTSNVGKLSPNDILGICYLRAMKHTPIQPFCIKRTNQYHSTNIDSSIASASAIRHAIQHHKNYQHTLPYPLEFNEIHTLEAYYPLLQYLLLTCTPSYLSKIFLMDEGIENHFIKQAKQSISFAEFLSNCTTSRYTASRIRRTLIHLLHQTTKKQMNTLPPLNFLHILGYTQSGKQYLKELKNQNIPYTSRIREIPLAYRDIIYKSAHIYGYPNNNTYSIKKEMHPPIFMEK